MKKILTPLGLVALATALLVRCGAPAETDTASAETASLLGHFRIGPSKALIVCTEDVIFLKIRPRITHLLLGSPRRLQKKPTKHSKETSICKRMWAMQGKTDKLMLE